MVPVLRTNWLVLNALSSRNTSWYSWLVFRGRAVSFMMEKWRVLTPRVEGSVPLFEAGWSSARRNPVWMFVAVGAKMDASERVTSTGMVLVSNNDPVMFGSWTTLLIVRSMGREYLQICYEGWAYFDQI